MGENTKIEWAHHSWNPWRGCTKVSAGCANCYAEKLSHRNPGVLGIWGDNGTRVIASESAWKEPLKWDQAAKAAGERHRVFCASLADVFEDWRGPIVDAKGERLFSYVDVNASAIDGSIGATLNNARAKLFRLIRQTPNLDWLLLTKRPENITSIVRRVGDMFEPSSDDRKAITRWMHYQDPPANLWLGTSVENQATADERIPHLLKVPAAVRFLSMEPLLGLVDLTMMPIRGQKDTWLDCLRGTFGTRSSWNDMGRRRVGWVIAGGESGPGARPMDPRWARDLRDQCVSAGVPFHFKQWGEWAPRDTPETQQAVNVNLRSTHFPQTSVGALHTHLLDDGNVMVRVGKKAAGRLLDGRTWDELPTLEATPC